MNSRIGSARDLGAAPPLDLPTADGERRTLQDFDGKPLVISFLWAANCLFCRAHVIRLIQARRDIESLGASVILVAYNDPELLTAKMMHDLDVPYTVLLDPTREAYARWGLGPITWRSKVSPGLYWEALKVMLRVITKRERSLGSAPRADQLGGDFVVNCSRTLKFVNRMNSFHDRATIPELLAALQACQSEEAAKRGQSIDPNFRFSPPAAAGRP